MIKGTRMRKHISKISLKSNTVRNLTADDLYNARGGARNDSLDEPSCNPCGDWPTSPLRGCTL